ncbi:MULTISPECIES: 4-hydroxy-tetrahydrodipicolinate reductase [Giesbergeria]|uniref:4-hydroxy-tetrahydrodipicolinate reductase n=1 Tax=Giesbergeria sinuosa TaxID=80883 RepID=A0ABV9QH19_9BURK
MMKIGVLGYGRAGKAVVNVLSSDPRFELRWVMRGRAATATPLEGLEQALLVGLEGLDLEQWFDQHPVDAVVDFSQADAVYRYGELLRERGIMLVSAISAYSPEHLEYLRQMGQDTRVMSSPNITLGINFLLLAAKMLREIAPFADVEVIEQHFRDKPEVSGTARKIAETLHLEDDRITSLRLGGIVGHHEVVFGFPHQTVRLVHDSIRREAFGTGAAFALEELARCDKGFYSFDDLLMQKIRHQLLNMGG